MFWSMVLPREQASTTNADGHVKELAREAAPESEAVRNPAPAICR
jgi:hypothetical protein